MTPEEAMGLISVLKSRGVIFRQRGRFLDVEAGSELIGVPLRLLIAEHWTVVTRAVAADHQTDRLLSRLCRNGGDGPQMRNRTPADAPSIPQSMLGQRVER